MNTCTTLKSALDLFLLEGESRRFTEKTLEFYQGRLSLFIRWCEPRDVMSIETLTHHHIRQYLVDLQQSGVSSAYHHSHARAIRAFLNYCVRDDLIAVSPFKKVKMPILEKKVPQSLSVEDFQKILKACKYERDKAIFVFLLDSGVRASELLSINVEDVDMKEGTVMIHLGKGQKGRTVYIGAGTRKQLKRYLIKERDGDNTNPKEPLFTRQDNNARLDYDGLKQMMRRFKNKTGVKFSAHVFRKTFAIMSLMNGMDIYVLAKLMGHADITVLRAYLNITRDNLKEAHKKFGVVDNL